ncbi:serine acetyltransferase [Mangrovimonas sp. TPBH4]|uniref:serine acetyltransferase n=1 Tax=Mangrovimonas sp. TPBH4 TaxID=1645914 RepID=UPI0006B62C4B|nr:serine acetyltransferase [Mangrovimonas sp. TPBH4]
MIQFKYLMQDVRRMIGRNKLRWLIILITRSFVGVFFYRFERCLYLVFGDYYKYIRIFFLPLLLLVQAYSNLDLHYKANIKGGLLILHPAMGCVISGYCNIGENLTLTGGNIIGVGKAVKNKEYRLDNNCSLGANAVIIGPIILGKNTAVGASACVVRSFEQGEVTLLGVPAKPYIR